ncbi:MAG: NADPH-dependent 7-cyano-7-deazaguanine reductase QueF [Fidelibacterota bacterium]|nr:MAG: NADPH-dependent 7-cyano-7-deazaguanine reductase QueF [Candidatus Neomarinimicrobiota bacterium]
MTKETIYELEVVPNRYTDRDYAVTISIPEFTCVCPRTGLPDFGTITINYVPDMHIIELKSLKYYILNYRERGIFHEEVTNQIMDDVKAAVQPRSIEVVGDFRPRGGIKTVVTARWPE